MHQTPVEALFFHTKTINKLSFFSYLNAEKILSNRSNLKMSNHYQPGDDIFVGFDDAVAADNALVGEMTLPTQSSSSEEEEEEEESDQEEGRSHKPRKHLKTAKPTKTMTPRPPRPVSSPVNDR